eukprot:CAMPEP_0170849094 /NCGR_PEP_ID=MMETSP0734-20130129/9785_1 /TAXON_ID=186038 /ORGANISM="Fragilariopsis kerguelensis, Strain L26-C5" /LENGTH=311 /DNA_ID=CAMNT_0011218661 /DNA_START=248 /DNA_END=1180 /DNA_ORIENTATION=+
MIFHKQVLTGVFPSVLVLLLHYSTEFVVVGQQPYSFVGGPGGDPATNTVEGDFTFIGAGESNTALEAGSAVVAGLRNTAAMINSFVGAGQGNRAEGLESAVVTGYENTAVGIDSVVGGGNGNTAEGSYSFVGSGKFNTAKGFESGILAGFNNVASGRDSVIIGGESNTASGDYSIAMGIKADANKDRSLVINLGKKSLGDNGKVVSSNKKGEFLVNSDSFTIRIGKKEVTIDKKNIQNFAKLLKNNGGRRSLAQQTHSDEQQSIIKEMQQQNEEQQATIEEQQAINEQQQGQIEKQQEQINKLYRMMTAAQ